MRKAFTYRLYPTKLQPAQLERTLRLCRPLYNPALQERRDACRKAGRRVGFQKKRWLPRIRAELPECKGVHSQVLQDVIGRVDKAFSGFAPEPGQRNQGFFRRVKRGQTPGYPSFRGQGRDGSFTFPQAGTAGVRVRGYARFQCATRQHRDVAAAIRVLTRARTEPAGMGPVWAVPWSRGSVP